MDVRTASGESAINNLTDQQHGSRNAVDMDRQIR